MYSIGMFSKINLVTTKTLRHYDEIGLLRPHHTDPKTGYRYYSSEQLVRMHRIQAYKQMGFSLMEIMALLQPDNARQTGALLERKCQALREEIRAAEHRLLRIENLLHAGKDDAFMQNYTATIKKIPACIVASMRQILPNYDTLMHLCPNVMGPEMRRLGCECAQPEYCFNIYHDKEYKERDIDAEICEAVTEAKADSELLCFKSIPAVPAAVCVLHRGSYDTLQQAYAFTMEWIQDNGYRMVDNPRESFIDGIWNKDKEQDWLTELQFPVEKI